MAAASEIHREMLDAWNSRNFDKFRSLLHPEYTYTGPDGKNLTGGPDVGTNIAQMYANAFPDGKLELKRVHTQGETAIAEFVVRGTHQGDLMGIAPTGKRIELNVCNIAEVRDGKVYREREYFDLMTMMAQLGVVTPPGKTATA